MRRTTPRPAAVVAAFALAAVALLLLLTPGTSAGPSAAAALPSSVVQVDVDPVLRARLAKSRTGTTAAIVTAWERSGLSEIQRLGVRGTRLQTLPMILTKSLTRAQLDRLASSPAVRSVYANRKYRVEMEDTTWITKARYVWDSPAAGGLGVTGKDVHVAVIDTGADGNHEDMDNLVEFCESTQAVSSDHTTVLCSPFNPAAGNAGPAGTGTNPRLDSTDDDGHGSHVSGTIAGSGQASGGREATHSTIGIAPDAKLHVYSANVGPSLLAHEILASYDDMISKKVKGLSQVVAVNNSWGGGGGSDYSPDSPQSVAFKEAYQAGILSVFAAGNSGPEHNTLGAQCVSPWVLCVAASTKPDSVVMFSSRGRPSEPADTNRDGVVGGTGDVAPGNHDRALGQALELGVYRPALTAPGVNINSISANAATCREGGVTADSGCYEPLNGTSMAAPHVTGAVALVVEGYRQGHGGATPSPGTVLDILERSAALAKLPGYEAEEQGAGRLNLFEAVKFARTYPNGLPRINLGTPSPAYAAGKHPGAPASKYTEKGCTGELSWTLPGAPNPLDIEGPPLATERYGQHVIDVPAKVERLRVLIDWSRHPGSNLYIRLWRPGVDPDQETASAGQMRVWPDQEALGLLANNSTPYIGPTRWLDVRAPEGATVEEGKWILRVYHRVGGATSACDADSKESPKQTTGYNYTLTIELPQVVVEPTVTITSPAPGSTVTGRYVGIQGTATYPTPWNGVTNWEVAGSGRTNASIHDDPNPANPRTVLHFHGNLHDAGSGVSGEASCTGDGRADLVACDGPMLLKSPNLASSPAASWKGSAVEWVDNGATDRTIYDPSWVWCLAVGPSCPETESPAPGPVTVEGAMTVEWWTACGPLCIGGGPDWFIRLWADGVLAFEQQLEVGPTLPNIPEKVRATVSLPRIEAEQRLTLVVEPVFLLNQFLPFFVYYDSQSACPGASGGGPCDSLVRMPVGTSGLGGGGGGAGPGPENVRVTDHHSSLVVAWDALSGATAYEIHRSTSPGFTPSSSTLLTTTPGAACTSPDVPSWPSASRAGLCYTDSAVSALTTYYYRVVGVVPAGKTSFSLLAYGTPSQFDRQVKVKVDRIYGPQYFEYASLLNAAGTSWSYSWDTLELITGQHRIGARSFTQGIGSAKASRVVKKDEDGDEGGKVRICHATGKKDKYVSISPTKAGIVHGHYGPKHQEGRDIIPPFEYRGQTYAQNWPQGQPVWANNCKTG